MKNTTHMEVIGEIKSLIHNQSVTKAFQLYSRHFWDLPESSRDELLQALLEIALPCDLCFILDNMDQYKLSFEIHIKVSEWARDINDATVKKALLNFNKRNFGFMIDLENPDHRIFWKEYFSYRYSINSILDFLKKRNKESSCHEFREPIRINISNQRASRENEVNILHRFVLFSTLSEHEDIKLAQVSFFPAGELFAYSLDNRDNFLDKMIILFQKDDYFSLLKSPFPEMNLKNVVPVLDEVFNDLKSNKRIYAIFLTFITERLIRLILNERIIDQNNPFCKLKETIQAVYERDPDLRKKELSRISKYEKGVAEKISKGKDPVERMTNAQNILKMTVGLMDSRIGDFFHAWILGIIRMEEIRGEIGHGHIFDLSKKDYVLIFSVFVRTLQVAGLFGIHTIDPRLFELDFCNS